MKVYVVTDSGSENVVLGVYANEKDAKECFKEAFEQFGHKTDSNTYTLEQALDFGYAYFEEEETYIEITKTEVQ